ELKWKNEKETLTEIKKAKKELETLRIDAEHAEARADLSKAAEIRYGTIPLLQKALETNSKRLKKLQSSRRILKEEIMANDIAEIVAKWTGIPVMRMVEEETSKLMRIEEELKARIIGQDNAINRVSDAIKRSRAGISDPNRPIGSFLFLGPTGVGKTELTKALAEFMFNDDRALIRVDMSEFMEKHALSKLIGAPPGYVGYEEGGTLTETIRHRPYAVILFDEIEKAHPEVFNILLQILDNGRLTDAKGRAVNFRNTIIILTSNIGAQFIDKMQRLGFSVAGKENDYEDAKNKVTTALKDHFRPEFLNRLDDIIIFDILTPEAVANIVGIQIREVEARLKVKELAISITPEVYAYLAKEGYNPQYGARPLKRLIQNKVLNPVASLIIGKGLEKGGSVLLTMKGGDIHFEVRKGRSGRNGNGHAKSIKSDVMTEEPAEAKI
ncbi:MAG: AAA family ATPase, partial [bacterium]|nr:AAA family ATPase [bacterium]